MSPYKCSGLSGRRKLYHRARGCLTIGGGMPDLTQAEIGRRMYHVHRGKRAEQAIKQMQQAAGAGWRSFSEDEVRLLNHLLQCTWNTVDQKQWDTIPFGKADIAVVKSVLALGEGVSPGH